MRTSTLGSRVTAVLGPTNTGKTHFAIERMLAHKTGMIGLPLRLLAREVYDKIVRLKGAAQVALITGEEKIIPQGATHYVCTVEAMPTGLGTAFLAVDEIQLCADPERGHVFTDRLLNARGEEETLFMGADTMRGAIQRFIPKTYFLSRSRFSDLAYTGPKKLTRLPRRSAVVGFSSEDVYGIAEMIRTHRGGAAVVLGALSPRTRNAQVALYQSGEVDFLVATDAIGMGLNMDVDHVAFSALEKFDGYTTRPLRPEEMGQIAGRAGRHMNDGTFGVTGEAQPLEAELVSRIENHHYDPVRVLQWRNSNLAFVSLEALVQSLDEPPPTRGLVKARPSSDLIALRTLAEQDEIKDRTTAPAQIRLLWDACQMPDFNKLSTEEHVRLVRTIFGHLMSDAGVLPEDWLSAQINRLDVPEGDVSTLSGRLAHIRTWTYAANRPGWVKDPGHWQELTRSIEDRLSDALHEKLTQRFIDKRTSVLMRSLREEDMHIALDDSGGVTVSGEAIGKLEGFRFTSAETAQGQALQSLEARALRAAAVKGLESEFQARARRLSFAPEEEITLSEHGRLWWDGAVVAKLIAGANPISPTVLLLADESLSGASREGVQRRLEDWIKKRIAAKLTLVTALETAIEAKPGTEEALPGEARAIAHQLWENFGSIDLARTDLRGDRGAIMRALRPYGVWFGRRAVYLPKLLRPEAASLLALLWSVWQKLDQVPTLPRAGLTSFESEAPDGFLAAAGFRKFAGRAIRLDMLERLEDVLEQALIGGETSDILLPKLVSLLGCGNDELKTVLTALGWQEMDVADGKTVWRREQPKPRRQQSRPQEPRERGERSEKPEGEGGENRPPRHGKHRGGHHKKRPQGEGQVGTQAEARGENREKHGKRPPRQDRRADKPQITVNPDSPFASLASLFQK
ncbi:ATP-dependent RNA helicase SUPV3L1/SUV3 [Rhizomicrobium palustre]|uniref:ATP-dependent RNA helicase SUPV3L1/SUV3 n=1 Tax=Rhizomicrobium palustre TaxID=189966 RepID=A0A846N4C9_9PROT|nr:helicase-related protein [Rhizomicrobium palustre]NIK90052.1 ATP-dependent RNA helicase SUPV3L1/SUV3 [Rhizomicrobium palustre]